MVHNKIFVITLGCDKNRVDGEVMIGHLRGAGFETVNAPENALAIIVNTCGFIQDAVRESIDMILELAEHKKHGSCKGLVIVGCMAKRYEAEIKETIPEADACIGVGEYQSIVDCVKDLIGVPENNSRASSDLRLLAREDAVDGHIAYVKIADGCDNNCTYCTIPSIRGSYVSRPKEEIIEECKQLVGAGAKELVLVAQDTALYGSDLYGAKKLPELLSEISATSGAKWIRLMYVYPEHITQNLIAALADLPNLCKYIDMPIQHCHDEIVASMGRSAGKNELFSLIRVLRERVPGITIRTTVMVGFPGEREEEFKVLYDFVKDAKFDRLGVFPYSREEGTPAASMKKQVSEDTKLSRLDRIMTLQQKIHFAKAEGRIGGVVPVIIDRADADGEYIGRTQGDAYEVDAIVYVASSNPLSPGEIVDVKITGADEYDLRGDVYEPTQ